MPRIYADNAATTKISQTAMKAMISAMENSYGNPSSIHQIGMAANDALQTASCLLYTSPSPRDLSTSRMPSSA